MRRLTHVIQTRVRRRINAAFKTSYGHRYQDLTRYITDKYGLHPEDARSIVFDIFRYIEVEVLRGSLGRFTIPRFGRFERRAIQHGEQQGGTYSSIVMRFTRAAIRRGGTYIDFDDEEWEDD